MNSRSLAALLSAVLLVHPVSAAPEASKQVDWVMTLGCRHCHFGEQTGITMCKGNCGPAAEKDGTVYLLTGSAIPKDFKKSGQWAVKGTVSPDGKTIAVTEMAAQAPAPADLKDEQPTKAAANAKPYTGTVAHTGAGLPTLTTTDKSVYHLKTSKAASKAAGHTLTRIGGGDLTGVFTATGATYEDDSHTWIVVDSIQPAK
ncbi:MAG TPA: hypothetical protein VGO11_09915 [Chthoniobacteraceae bacterium]|jgi:hypothetical protein|nr:hypothetical protein [Chthoniobacteraceae bacterium]